MKKTIAINAFISLAILAFPVLAHEEDAPKPTSAVRGLEKVIERIEKIELPDIESAKEHPFSFFAGPHGEARIQSGEVTSLASTTITVKVWGLSLSINIANTRYTPNETSASTLKTGDKVNIKGAINKDTGVITATVVHQLSSRRRMVDELFLQITRLIERLRELQRKAGLLETPLPQPPTSTTTP